jgi:ribosomal protein L7/L12
MTLHFKLPEQNAIAADAQRLLDAGVEQEVVIGVLCRGGLSKIDSIKLMSELMGMPLIESQKVVQQSRAWQHGFPRDTAFHAQLDEVLRALREDDAGGPSG